MQSTREKATDRGSAAWGAPRLSVLHVTAPAAIGGLERVVHGLAGGQRARGHRVLVVAVIEPEVREHAFADGLREAGVEVIDLRLTSRAYRAERAALREICLDFAPHIMHTHGFRSDVVDGPVARRLGVATVATVHGFTATTLRGYLYEWIQRRSLRSFDAVVAVSRPMRDRLRAAGVAEERLHLLPNAWPGMPGTPLGRGEARRRLGLPDQGLWIGWVGRFTAEKGPDLFLEALRGVRGLSWRAGVVGDGPMAAALVKRARALELQDHVTWLGLVPGAGLLLPAFDLLVVSSRTEGTPILLFEAMAAGVPIVATAVGGIPDVLREGEALLSLPTADALAATLRTALTSRDLWPKWVAAASRRLADYAPEPWLASYDALYWRLLKEQRKGAAL